jgi:antitoxin component YwqK of YwqJK toxin-antitoxin module
MYLPSSLEKRLYARPTPRVKIGIVLALITLLMAGCQTPPPLQDSSVQLVAIKEPLLRVNIVDHSNLSETFTSPERLKELVKRNYLEPQPYRKVARVFARDKEGSAHSIVTSYYENGQVRQYLECVNGRACGVYQEWHSNGQKKLVARVLAGRADIDEKALTSWAFDGECTAWDEQGVISATFTYQHGALNGPSTTFYSTGERASETPYENGLQEGQQIVYSKSGQILGELSFHNGARHGPALGRYDNGADNWKEEYVDDHLMQGAYLAQDGTQLSSVVRGEGVRSTFDDGRLVSQEEVHLGLPEGWTTTFDANGLIDRKYQVKDEKKNGTEIWYFPGTTQEKLEIEWHDGMIHGTVKTWYPSGVLESQREMSQNMKQGVATAWYLDGSLQLVEEYNDNKLVRGRYHRKGDTAPVSTIEKGNGIATLFDASGTIIEKVPYLDSKPQIGD